MSSIVKLVASGFQARLKEAVTLEKHVLLKKLRDTLEALRGRVAGSNKDDVEEAIAMVGYSQSPNDCFYIGPLLSSIYLT